MLLVLTSSTMNAQPMSYYAMRDNARFLTDRMAHTLGVASYLLDDLYRINYDYIYGVNEYLDDVACGYYYDDYMAVVYARDAALRRLLTAYQWNRYISLDYFYRPISFGNSRWRFAIYAHDPFHTRFYYREPIHFASYRGGHFFGGMRAGLGHPGRIGGPARPAHPGGGPGYHIGSVPPNRDNRGNEPGRFDPTGNHLRDNMSVTPPSDRRNDDRTPRRETQTEVSQRPSTQSVPRTNASRTPSRSSSLDSGTSRGGGSATAPRSNSNLRSSSRASSNVGGNARSSSSSRSAATAPRSGGSAGAGRR